QIVVGCGPGFIDQVAVSVVVIGIGYRAAYISEEAHIEAAVIAVEVRRGRAGGPLVLSVQKVAVGIALLDYALDNFLNHWRQPGGILLVNQVLGRDPANGFGNPVAECVISQSNWIVAADITAA